MSDLAACLVVAALSFLAGWLCALLSQHAREWFRERRGQRERQAARTRERCHRPPDPQRAFPLTDDDDTPVSRTLPPDRAYPVTMMNMRAPKFDDD